jgi:hypothetical protein
MEKDAIYRIAAAARPCSSRHIYYAGIGVLWEKDTGNKRTTYQRVNRYVGEMREAGELPWRWITDSTRLQRVPDMHDSVEDALAETARFYRRNLWTRQPHRLEVWCESDSIGSVIEPVTTKYGVGLFSCRGQSGKGFIWQAVQEWFEAGKPVTVLYVGDHDPSGLAIPRSVRERQERYADGDIDLDFRRIAVTPEDVAEGGFVGHSVNRKDANYRRFVDYCTAHDLDPEVAVEVEAIPASDLRARLEQSIDEMVVDADSWNATIAAEESEREILLRIAGRAS